MAPNTNTTALSQLGVSLWLDDLSRSRMESGNLTELVESRNIVGVTTNPAIFQAAISGASEYDEDLARLKSEGSSVDDALTALTTDDVRRACDLFETVYATSGGKDGRVSIEVDPRLAHDEEKTVEQALALHSLVARDNVMIKIPATDEGLAAITRVTAEGISVNVTLIFSLERYRQVIDAYLTGLERAAEAGKDLSTIHSVASFFVSRVDSEIDARLEKIGGTALELRGKAGIANARCAYTEFLSVKASDRVRALTEKGANMQRPLWASTGVKNPEYPDTMYVDQLAGEDVVNTVPEKTLEAVADHASIDDAMSAEQLDEAPRVLMAVADAGVDLSDVFATLEREGVEKFEKAWDELIDAVKSSL